MVCQGSSVPTTCDIHRTRRWSRQLFLQDFSVSRKSARSCERKLAQITHRSEHCGRRLRESCCSSTSFNWIICNRLVPAVDSAFDDFNNPSDFKINSTSCIWLDLNKSASFTLAQYDDSVQCYCCPCGNVQNPRRWQSRTVCLDVEALPKGSIALLFAEPWTSSP